MATGHELLITRDFDAPRSELFEAWTEPEQLAQWCSPHGFTIPDSTGDLRPGGAWRCRMRALDGEELGLQGVYREIVAPERLAFTHAWEDAQGRPGHETLVTVTFTERRGWTRMIFRQRPFLSAESRDGHRGGWTECFDKLADHLAAVRR